MRTWLLGDQESGVARSSPRKMEAVRELAMKSPKVFTMMARTASAPKCSPTKVPGRLRGAYRGRRGGQ